MNTQANKQRNEPWGLVFMWAEAQLIYAGAVTALQTTRALSGLRMLLVLRFNRLGKPGFQDSLQHAGNFQRRPILHDKLPQIIITSSVKKQTKPKKKSSFLKSELQCWEIPKLSHLKVSPKKAHTKAGKNSDQGGIRTHDLRILLNRPNSKTRTGA